MQQQHVYFVAPGPAQLVYPPMMGIPMMVQMSPTPAPQTAYFVSAPAALAPARQQIVAEVEKGTQSAKGDTELEDRQDAEEYTANHTVGLTGDVYSMSILCNAGYCSSGNSREDMVTLLYVNLVTLATFIIQAASLAYCIIDKTGTNRSNNCCSTLLDSPVNVKTEVRLAQWFAVIYSLLSLENILCVDTLAYINNVCCFVKRILFGWCITIPNHSYASEACEDSIGSGNLFAFAIEKVPLSYTFYAGCRIVIGCLTLVTQILIVCQSDVVTDVFANFAALTVIAGLDNLVFEACIARFMGARPRRLCIKTQSLEFMAEDMVYALYTLRAFVVIFLLVPFIGALASVTQSQINGAHCPELVVKTAFPELGGLSGMYRWGGTFTNGRPLYRMVHLSGKKFGERITLGHCEATTSWVILAFKENEPSDSNAFQEACQTKWIMTSPLDDTYNLFNAHLGWSRFSRDYGIENVPGFMISCAKCEASDEDLHCNRAGTCSKDKQRCVCEVAAAGFGTVCDFSPPCWTVNISFTPGGHLTDFVKAEGPTALNLTKVAGVYEIVKLPRCKG
jgi:hypothetical protein